MGSEAFDSLSGQFYGTIKPWKLHPRRTKEVNKKAPEFFFGAFLYQIVSIQLGCHSVSFGID
jgi:hypothetical protein